MPSGPLSLYLEATQLKTVCTETVVLRAKSVVTKAQVAGIITLRRNCRRPNVPAAADLPQRSVVVRAIARGRAAVVGGFPRGM